MLRKLGILTVMLIIISATSVLAEDSVVSSKYNLSFGGYVKIDYVNNSNAVGPRTPGPPGGGFVAGSKDESILTARQSRFWLKASGPTVSGAKTNALIEMDFYGGGSSSNEFGNLRMRHAYGTLDWPDTQVLIGQYSDLFAPAAADTIDGRQGNTTGAPGSPRVSQIRVTQKIKFDADNTLKIVAGVQNPVQDAASSGSNSSSKYLGSDGTGPYGSMVNIAGQVFLSSNILGVSPKYMGRSMSPLEVGVFGLRGDMKLVGNKRVDNYGYGVYAFAPIVKSRDGKSRSMTLSLEGQAYKAEGMDVQGATNGIALKSTTNTGLVGTFPDKSGAKGFGYYGQLKFYVTQDLGLTAGHMARKADDSSQYPSNYEQKNQLSYVNATYDLTDAFRVASEFEHLETTYGKLTKGTPGYAQNNVIRLAAYFFF
ncbi:MAG: hypothetical protein PHF56_17255 [Desulfuromonadaceae bacterium]|nr:hypothetical protein [Desulfuromonadaceae bacterium]